MLPNKHTRIALLNYDLEKWSSHLKQHNAEGNSLNNFSTGYVTPHPFYMMLYFPRSHGILHFNRNLQKVHAIQGRAHGHVVGHLQVFYACTNKIFSIELSVLNTLFLCACAHSSYSILMLLFTSTFAECSQQYCFRTHQAKSAHSTLLLYWSKCWTLDNWNNLYISSQ